MNDDAPSFLFIAQILKTGLKNNEEDIPDIAIVRAPNKQVAAERIRDHNWDDPLWIKGKSGNKIRSIHLFTELVAKKLIPEPQPKRRRKPAAKKETATRRRRKAA